jgi:hypothetical protein
MECEARQLWHYQPVISLGNKWVTRNREQYETGRAALQPENADKIWNL